MGDVQGLLHLVKMLNSEPVHQRWFLPLPNPCPSLKQIGPEQWS